MVFRSMNRYRRAPNHRYLYRRHLNSPFPSEVANIYQYGYIAKYFQTLGGVALLDRGKEGLKRFARNAKHSCTTITRLMYTELMRVHRNIYSTVREGDRFPTKRESLFQSIDTPATWVDSIYKTIKIPTNCTDKPILCVTLLNKQRSLPVVILHVRTVSAYYIPHVSIHQRRIRFLRLWRHFLRNHAYCEIVSIKRPVLLSIIGLISFECLLSFLFQFFYTTCNNSIIRVIIRWYLVQILEQHGVTYIYIGVSISIPWYQGYGQGT